MPTLATSTMPIPIAAASLPAIPSIPSMKLNRLTNHTQSSAPAMASSPGDSQPWKIKPCGSAQIPAATAANCAKRRTAGDKPRRSSNHDTTASPVAPSATTIAIGGKTPAAHSASQATTLTPITAMPPPRGVGTACDERSFGRSSTARCRSNAISALVPRQETAKAAPATMTTHPKAAMEVWKIAN